MNLAIIVIKDFIKKFGDYNSNMADNMMTNQDLIKLFYEVLINMGYQKENQKVAIIQTIQVENIQVEDKINNIKMNILKTFHQMTEILNNKQNQY